mmetsp:Transcript_4058/g.6595  ORF Transcript_4058/g.6595 Transcript_4058/m.6595 type:complete len:185 (+) Transcript_4058:11-565(+)
MLSLLFLTFVGLSLASSECNTNGDTTACCTEVIGSGLCANITWIPAKKAIDVKTSFGPLQLLAYEFTPGHTSACGGKGTVSACIDIKNYTVTSTGCCGCVDAKLKAGPITLDERIACFAFGTGTNCPDTSCSQLSDCANCNARLNCGWCMDSNMSGKCMEGTQTGPAGGSCPTGNKWIGHKNQC